MRPAFSRTTPMTDSRFIESMRYAHNTRTLELVMHGKRYRYYGVGERKATRLAAAPSAGAYYNAQIKGRHPRRKFSSPLPVATAAANAWNRANPGTARPVAYEQGLGDWVLRYGFSQEDLRGGLFHGMNSLLEQGGTMPNYAGAIVEFADGRTFATMDIYAQL